MYQESGYLQHKGTVTLGLPMSAQGSLWKAIGVRGPSVMRSFCARVLLGLLAIPLGVRPLSAADDYVIPSAKKNHWAWRPPVRHPPPRVQNAAWLRNPIDAFILAKLEAA